MPSEETNELISAKEAADLASKTSVDSFMSDVNRAIRYASKHGEYSVDIDNYGTGHTLIKTKLLADSIEVLLKSAGYHTNVVFRRPRRETCHPAPLGAGEPFRVAYDRRET